MTSNSRNQLLGMQLQGRRSNKKWAHQFQHFLAPGPAAILNLRIHGPIDEILPLSSSPQLLSSVVPDGSHAIYLEGLHVLMNGVRRLVDVALIRWLVGMEEPHPAKLAVRSQTSYKTMH